MSRHYGGEREMALALVGIGDQRQIKGFSQNS
jgi:hypothetical protein